jgi:hypothetical protein
MIPFGNGGSTFSAQTLHPSMYDYAKKKELLPSAVISIDDTNPRIHESTDTQSKQNTWYEKNVRTDHGTREIATDWAEAKKSR